MALIPCLKRKNHFKPFIMTEIRSFLLAAGGTLGLLEVTNSEVYLAAESEPEYLLTKALITLIAGTVSTIVTHLLKQSKSKKCSSKHPSKPLKKK
jgi:hypothetical protein